MDKSSFNNNLGDFEHSNSLETSITSEITNPVDLLNNRFNNSSVASGDIENNKSYGMYDKFHEIFISGYGNLRGKIQKVNNNIVFITKDAFGKDLSIILNSNIVVTQLQEPSNNLPKLDLTDMLNRPLGNSSPPNNYKCPSFTLEPKINPKNVSHSDTIPKLNYIQNESIYNFQNLNYISANNLPKLESLFANEKGVSFEIKTPTIPIKNMTNNLSTHTKSGNFSYNNINANIMQNIQNFQNNDLGANVCDFSFMKPSVPDNQVKYTFNQDWVRFYSAFEARNTHIKNKEKLKKAATEYYENMTVTEITDYINKWELNIVNKVPQPHKCAERNCKNIAVGTQRRGIYYCSDECMIKHSSELFKITFCQPCN